MNKPKTLVEKDNLQGKSEFSPAFRWYCVELKVVNVILKRSFKTKYGIPELLIQIIHLELKSNEMAQIRETFKNQSKSQISHYFPFFWSASIGKTRSIW